MNLDKISEIIEFVKMEKSLPSRVAQDKVYNQQNGRSSPTPKVSIGMKMPPAPKLPSLPTGSTGIKGRTNKPAGSNI